MGIHFKGFFNAIILPAILTNICYFGTWVITYNDGHLKSIVGMFFVYHSYLSNSF